MSESKSNNLDKNVITVDFVSASERRKKASEIEFSRLFDELLPPEVFENPRIILRREEVKDKINDYLRGKVTENDFDQWLVGVHQELKNFDCKPLEPGDLYTEEHPLFRKIRILVRKLQKKEAN